MFKLCIITQLLNNIILSKLKNHYKIIYIIKIKLKNKYIGINL
jgi:hypothetical protein